MSGKRTPQLYISDIRECIRRIEKYTKEISKRVFESDEKTVDAVIRNLQVIGEAVSQLPKDFKDKYEDIPWRKIKGMRNKVVHEYFGVDWDILWDAIHDDIPELKKRISKVKF